MSSNKYKYEYCPVCDEMMVPCPHCGNTTCNGGCGCKETWEFFNNTETPPKPSDWKEQRRKMQEEFDRMFK